MLVRTPLGGFINHSDNPNCTKIKSTSSDFDYITIGDSNTLSWTQGAA